MNDIESRFYKLLKWWHEDTRHLSSTTAMTSHQAYQQIIAMGWDVVPTVLRHLQAEPDHLFCALNQITGHDPVPYEDRGRIKKMAEHWIDWGKEHGHI